MALKNSIPNPLNFFNLRRVHTCAPHFEYTTVQKTQYHLVKKLANWIETNLNKRYYIDQNISVDHTNSFVYNIKIGFEDKKELSFFLLTCPFL